jgi:hypothetical protein
MTASMLLATKQLNDNTVSPGVLGFAVVVALGIAVYFLLRSFRKHIERVPKTFDVPAQGSPGESVKPAGELDRPAGPTGSAGPAGGPPTAT